MSRRALAIVVLLWSCLVARQSRAEGDLRPCAEDIRLTEAPAARSQAFSTAAAADMLAKADCDQTDVYCVDASGYPIPSEQRDPHLRSGQALTIKLLGPKSCDQILTVGSDVKQSGVVLFRPDPGTVNGKALPAIKTVADVELQLLAKSTASTDATTLSVTVVVSRADADVSLKGIRLTVTPPRYYLDVGLLVSFTPSYQRVSTSRAPGSTEQYIREERTIHPSAAVTVNYFPLGQYAAARPSWFHGLGVQAGIGGNLSKLDDEFYLGAIWEPVPGAGLSAGLALHAMERLQPDYPSGALVSPNDVPRDHFLGPRFYFGVCLNTQVFQTVLSLGEKALVPN